MTPFEIIIIIFLFGISILIWLLWGKSQNQSSSQQPIIEWLKSTQEDISKLRESMTQTLQQSDKNVTDTLQQSYKSMNERLDNAARVIGELKSETGKFSEIGRSMQELQDFLNSPKLRGNIGEQILNDLIAQVLPQNSYTLQHRFRSGDIVDAVITTKAGLIPIDSKFPMENYSKMAKSETKKEQASFSKTFVSDVKKHIKTIATKYINADENTVDFALMYVPSEAIYYEITANQPDLTQSAQDNRVLIVSPSTFYAFLKTILVSFEGARIAKEAQVILKQIRSIQKDAGDFSGKLDTLSRHVTNAYNNMNVISSDYNHLLQKIETTSTLSQAENPTIEAGKE
jgi:DNA recombination protein RmuC